MSKNNYLNFVEKPSKQHFKNVLQAVEPELLINRKQSYSYKWMWLSGACTLAVCAMVYFQVINPVQKNTDLEAALSDNLIMELAALSPDEMEIVEDLDFMDALDELSPEELEELL